MPTRPVAVLPAVVGREQVAESGEQVVVGAGPGLEDRDPGRRVRDEQLQQAVALAGDERGAVTGQVQHGLGRAGAVVTGLGPHGEASWSVASWSVEGWSAGLRCASALASSGSRSPAPSWRHHTSG